MKTSISGQVFDFSPGDWAGRKPVEGLAGVDEPCYKLLNKHIKIAHKGLIHSAGGGEK